MGQPISKGPLLCLDIANKDEAVISLRSASPYVTATCLLFVCFCVCWFDICRKISHSFTQPLLLWQPQPLVDHSPTQLGSIKDKGMICQLNLCWVYCSTIGPMQNISVLHNMFSHVVGHSVLQVLFVLKFQKTMSQWHHIPVTSSTYTRKYLYWSPSPV